jgi:hypothetical protein
VVEWEEGSQHVPALALRAKQPPPQNKKMARPLTVSASLADMTGLTLCDRIW